MGMPNPAEDTFRFVEQIAGETDKDAVIEAFRGRAGEFGYTTFALGELPRPGSAGLPSFFVSGWPDSWVETYVGDGLAAHDPCIIHAVRGISAASFAELREGGHQSKATRRTLDAAAAGGWPEGLAIPVHGPRGYRGLVTLAGSSRDLPLRHRVALHLMGLYLHNKLLALHDPARLRIEEPSPLSAGEVECIHWLLAGKSDWEIGEILGIAEATAHWRIEQAKRKLGVKTRAQLTALAVHYGLVRP
jgi:DNA-binding CsgD family transcriptional regulator